MISASSVPQPFIASFKREASEEGLKSATGNKVGISSFKNQLMLTKIAQPQIRFYLLVLKRILTGTTLSPEQP